MGTDLLQSMKEIPTGSLWTPEAGFNTNALDPTQFKILFSRMPGYVFFCQSIELPSLSLPTIPRLSPKLNHSEVGEIVNFGNLNTTMILDSKLDNYKELYKWMKDLSVLGLSSATTSSASVVVGTDTNIIEFVNIWPTQIGSVLFTSTPDLIQYALSSVTWQYDYFHFPEVNDLKLI